MQRLLAALTLLSAACAEPSGECDMRPLILYENVLEGATLTPSSTAAGSVDSLKTRVPKDRWTSNADALHTVTAQLSSAMLPTAWAMSRHDLELDEWAALDSDDFSATPQDPLTIGWTDVGDEELRVISGYVTDDSKPALSGNVRHYVRSGIDAWFALGEGFVQADVQFSSISTPFNQAGVSCRDSSSGAFLAAVMRPGSSGTGVATLYAAETGGGALSTLASGPLAMAAATDYALTLELDGRTARLHVDGVALLSADLDALGVLAGFAPTQQGIFQSASTPASNTAQWDNFAAGVAGAVLLRGGDDGATWPYAKLFRVRSAGTFIGAIDDATAREYWRWEFPQSASRSLTIGCLALGRRLDFTEAMAQGFDPTSLKLVTHQARSNSGEYLGSVRRYPAQSAALRFGPAGLSTADFFNAKGRPSWQDFIESTWSLGRSFWFAWDLTQRPDDMWFCMVPDRAMVGAPFITAIRRGWKMSFDVLAERVGT